MSRKASENCNELIMGYKILTKRNKRIGKRSFYLDKLTTPYQLSLIPKIGDSFYDGVNKIEIPELKCISVTVSVMETTDIAIYKCIYVEQRSKNNG